MKEISSRKNYATIYDYSKEVNYLLRKKNNNNSITLIKSVTLGWDNAPRRKDKFLIYYNFSLKKYFFWLRKNIEYARENLPKDDRFIFINAWNEWAEGTYLEPDKKYGYASINATSRALFDLSFFYLKTAKK